MHMGGAGRIHGADYSLVDYNRAGVPLLEIVSEPDIRSAEQAKRYVEELRAALLAIGVSDVKMEEGSLRVDANVSVRAVGSSELGTRCEIKNLNSLRSLLRAIELRSRAPVGSRARTASASCRRRATGTKERAARSPVARRKKRTTTATSPSPTSFRSRPPTRCAPRCGRSMPELPAARRDRYVERVGDQDEDARVLVDVPGLADYAETGGRRARTAAARAKDVVNWVRQDVLAYLNENDAVARGARARDARRAGRARRRGHDLAQPGARTCSTSRCAKRSGRATSSKSTASRR